MQINLHKLYKNTYDNQIIKMSRVIITEAFICILHLFLIQKPKNSEKI